MLNCYQIALYFAHFFIRAKCFSDYSLESARFFNETSKIPLYGTIKLRRLNHNYPKIFMDMELTDSFQNYDGEIKAYYSPLGNTRYILLPFKIYRQPVCQLLNNEYRNRLMHDLRNYSNFPFSEDKKVDLCDLMPMGHYYWKNYSAGESTVPRSLAPGRYRVHFFVYKKHEKVIANGLEFSSLFT